MKILALETSGRRASCALADGSSLVSSAETPADQRSASSFFPVVQQQLQAAGWKPSDVELIAVTTGPGSFTGLRIGVTMAKTLAYVSGAEVLGVNTLRVIAAQAGDTTDNVEAVLDAQRQEVFVAKFQATADGQLVEESPTQTMAIERWLANLSGPTLVNGPVLAKLKDRLPESVQTSAENAWAPSATTLASSAWADFQAGRRDDLWTLSPQYFRQSAAEEKLQRG